MNFRRKKKSHDRFRRHIQKQRERLRRGIVVLPHIITLTNAFFGFCSIAYAYEGKFIMAAYFILLAALMDLLDGRIARLMHATSDMGMHLDSLSDAVSFCLAPAFLVFSWRLKAFGFMGILVCSIFFLAGQLRLARFNVLHITQLQSILGLPSTIAGCFVAALMLNVGHVDAPWFLIVLSSVLLALAATMVSIIPFPTFKQKLLGLRVSPQVAVFVALVAIIALLQFNLALLVSFSGYILSALVPAALRRFKRPFQEKL